MIFKLKTFSLAFILLAAFSVSSLSLSESSVLKSSLGSNSNIMLYSPIKINLKGEKAVVTDKGAFKLDADGFQSNTMPIVQASAGLESNEAWLVINRNQTGIIKNGVVNGDALFGDHLGHFSSGYDDLIWTFKKDVKRDSKTLKYYIELSPEPFFESIWHNIQKFFGVRIPPQPYNDLKLLTADNRLIEAHTVLKRIDVSSQKVDEISPNRGSAIMQRADVYYQDGHKASSADLWIISFKPLIKNAKSK